MMQMVKRLYVAPHQRQEVLTQLQMLTNDKLGFDEKGQVYIVKKAEGNLAKPYGTNLIRNVIAH